MILRPYQNDAIRSVYEYLNDHDDNPCIVIPTAGGKTPILATICRQVVEQWNGRVLIVTHVKELLQQAVEKLNLIAPEMWNKTGVYSAGLKSRDTEHPIIVAGIQSVYKRPEELGHFNLVIVDEAHSIPPDGDGMYHTLMAGLQEINPRIRILGLTATPFRMKGGSICKPENILNAICYEINVRELIVQGFICPLISRAGKEKIDTSGLHVHAGEFISSEIDERVKAPGLSESACREIISLTENRNSVLIFCSGIDHAMTISAHLYENTDSVDVVIGKTPSDDRSSILERFKAGKLKYLVNVNVLTTGFDAPNIDCVVLLRPTMSPGLYYQMVGRGFRIHDGKENCMVLDYGNNIVRHGPVDMIRIKENSLKAAGEAPAKECPECMWVIAAGYSICPNCGYEFPKKEHDIEPMASPEGILSGQTTDMEYQVTDIEYAVHYKRNAPEDAPKTMRVEYHFGFCDYQSEWICFEHTGYARMKAEAWWKFRTDMPVPDTAAEAVEAIETEGIREPIAVTVRSIAGERFNRIAGYKWGKPVR